MSASIFEILSTWYYASDPSKYIVLSGANIPDLKVVKSGMKWPFQNATVIDVTPHNYELHLHAMSSENLPFILPGVFTIGPDIHGAMDSHDEDMLNLKKYARFLATAKPDKRDSIIKGVIEGETRVLAAQMTIDQLFKDRIKFKETITEKIDEELKQFGLRIYNANVKELADAEDSQYFSEKKKKILAEALNTAKIDVATAETKGDSEKKNQDTKKRMKLAELETQAKSGEKEQEMIMRMNLAEMDSKAISSENLQKENIAKSNAKLSVIEAEQNKLTKIAKITSEREAELKDMELKEAVNKAKVKMTTEELRSSEFAKACVDAEIKVKLVEAEALSIKAKAEAELYKKQKEAEGIQAVFSSEAKGIENLLKSFNGDTNALTTYLMLQKDQYTKLAEANAKAIKDLNPKITVWNTGSNNENDALGGTIRNLMQSIPPLFTTIQDQTGVKILPNIVQTPNDQ